MTGRTSSLTFRLGELEHFMKKNGERQVAIRIEDVRADHRSRYDWAASKLLQDDTVLDAGCGVGYGTYTLAQKARNAVGIDCDAETIEFAKKNWLSENMNFECGTLYALDFPESLKFSAVTAFEVIEHLVQPELFLKSLKRFISQDAKIFVSCPNEEIIGHTVDLNPFHIRHYSPKSFTELMEDSGYKVVNTLTQDVDELHEGDSGRTLVLECRSRLGNHAKASESSPGLGTSGADLLVALAASEREINKRARSIRNLQAKVKKLKKMVRERA